MARSYSRFWPIVTLIIGVFVVLIALPQEWKAWAPGFLRSPALHLGLDLAGGTQLDFRISEDEINRQLVQINQEIETLERNGGSAEAIANLRVEQRSIQEQKNNLIEAIRTVLERRINALGVSEAVITPSYIGEEKHLLVECPGVVDTQECIQVVGKTIQLEFKEEFTEANADFTNEVRANVAATIERMSESGSSLVREGQDMGDELGMLFADDRKFYKDLLPKGLEGLWDTPPGRLVTLEGSVPSATQDAEGNVGTEEVPGIFLAEVIGPRTQTGRTVNEASRAFQILAGTEDGLTYTHHEEQILDQSVNPQISATLRGMQNGDLKAVTVGDTTHVLFLRGLTKGAEQMDVSHIFVPFKGAQDANASITRSKEQALAKINGLKDRLDAGENFEQLARAESEGDDTRNVGGRIGTITRQNVAIPFAEAAFALDQGEISDPVETQYGFHIIRADKAASVTPDRAKYEELVVTGADSVNRANGLIGRMQNGDVTVTEEILPVRFLFFSLKPSGWKDTALDGKHFRSAAVTTDPVTNIPVVQITFDDEGGRLFQELTKKNIGKPIAIFVGGEMVSAPTVQQEISGGTAVITGSRNFEEARLLAQDLNTGAIPAPIHLVGQHTVEATLGANALQTSLQAALIGTLILMLYMILVYRLLGLVANVALVVYAAIFFTILKLPLFLFSSTYIVLTLAGMAGIILSLGMAVDANVLVFERMKEELKKGKLMKTAVETSYQHAWPAIRDGNVSTLITCAILFLVGTSLVRGFAITLGMGVLLSMFTAITITRWILRRIAVSDLANRPALFGVRGSQNISTETTAA